MIDIKETHMVVASETKSRQMDLKRVRGLAKVN
jgi:hypothetical protein